MGCGLVRADWIDREAGCERRAGEGPGYGEIYECLFLPVVDQIRLFFATAANVRSRSSNVRSSVPNVRSYPANVRSSVPNARSYPANARSSVPNARSCHHFVLLFHRAGSGQYHLILTIPVWGMYTPLPASPRLTGLMALLALLWPFYPERNENPSRECLPLQ